MNEKEYLRLKAKLDADYQRKLEALNTVLAMDGGDPQAAPKTSQPAKLTRPAKKAQRVSLGSVSGAITALLPTFGSHPFTAAHVQELLRKDNPGINSSSISSAITRLALDEDGPLEIVTPGKGRRSTIFKNRALRAKVG